MSVRLYIAAALSEAARARAAADVLTASGIHVVSTWHHRVTAGEPDPTTDAERGFVAKHCARELARAQTLLALTDQGNPRGTYVEIGMALAMAMPVFWLVPADVHDWRRTVFDGHPYVTRGTHFGELEAAILRFARTEPELSVIEK